MGLAKNKGHLKIIKGCKWIYPKPVSYQSLHPSPGPPLSLTLLFHLFLNLTSALGIHPSLTSSVSSHLDRS